MTSTIKVDNIQKVSDGSSIIKKCGSTITVGSCGATVALASGASQTGFGTPSSSVLWCTTAKTSPFTAADKVGYFVNTSGGVVTVTLPASPSAGDVVAIKDYANTFDTNAVTIGRNGSKINGVCACAKLTTESQSVTLIYVDGTKGWQDIQDSTSNVTGAAFIVATGGTIVDCGNFRTHIFTSTGPFQVTGLSINAPENNADYLVVGGGGGGGGSHGGGAGAGGFRVSNSLSLSSPTMSPLVSGTGVPISIQNYTISVGAGGTAPSPPSGYGTAGVLSTFATITSAGGGRGSTAAGANPLINGGSGGGGTYSPNPGTPGGGTGNTPPVSPPQGQNGGNGGTYGPGAAAGGGGGGTGGTGTAGSPSNAGPGGIGSFISDAFIGPTAPSYGTPGPTSSTRYFAGGGGAGATIYGAPSTPTGGAGGGGNGQSLATSDPTSGSANTGGGGGGGSGGSTGGTPCGSGGAGGSGVVMIRYRFQ